MVTMRKFCSQPGVTYGKRRKYIFLDGASLEQRCGRLSVRYCFGGQKLWNGILDVAF